jgi:nucleoid DNA-binding protein
LDAREPLTIVLTGAGPEPVSKTLRKMFRAPGHRVFNTAYHRVAWSRAVALAGLGTFKTRKRTGRRIHDCRCSAAVNLVDAGVPEDLVIKIGG